MSRFRADPLDDELRARWLDDQDDPEAATAGDIESFWAWFVRPLAWVGVGVAGALVVVGVAVLS